ncbi:MAG: DEAD/DEAH box helicase, partial [Thermoplasmata archaeon]|nr:DEAD/DEAH box helicase [Thermoplasmata archaeon]
MKTPDGGSRASPASLGVPAEIVEILTAQGIREFYPPQAAAVPPVLRGESVLVSCPTASGKSLIAYLALLRAVRAGRTGLYLVPLRALGQEKAEELEAFASLGIKVGLSIGDFDISAEKLEKLDILVATSEKADGLLRKGAPWLDRVGTVVADEVHLIRDPDRGPTLEVSLTRLRRRKKDLQIVALSATVGNSAEVARWLGAKPILSDFRPVPLRAGAYHEGRILFTDLTTQEVAPPGDPVPRLVRDVILDGGQALVFVSTRKASELLAQALGRLVHSLLDPAGRDLAAGVARALHEVGEEETEGARRLTEMVPNGVAFHNASLTNPERRVVERGFRDRALKVLVATPTLAAGINLPARRVIIRDTSRYDDHLGMQAPIPAIEVQQMCGRAGRPRYDATGEAIVIARSEDDQERILDQYLSAAPEDVVSRLATEPALRTHLLALVASGEVAADGDLESFFASTFYGQTQPFDTLRSTLRGVREFLIAHDLLQARGPLKATGFGQLTSELYLDPITAVLLRRAIERAPLGVSSFALFATLAVTPDLTPMFLRSGEEAVYMQRFGEEREELLLTPEEEGLVPALEVYLAGLKTATVLDRWIEERPIVEITRDYGIGAG